MNECLHRESGCPSDSTCFDSDLLKFNTELRCIKRADNKTKKSFLRQKTEFYPDQIETKSSLVSQESPHILYIKKPFVELELKMENNTWCLVQEALIMNISLLCDGNFMGPQSYYNEAQECNFEGKRDRSKEQLEAPNLSKSVTVAEVVFCAAQYGQTLLGPGQSRDNYCRQNQIIGEAVVIDCDMKNVKNNQPGIDQNLKIRNFLPDRSSSLKMSLNFILTCLLVLQYCL